MKLVFAVVCCLLVVVRDAASVGIQLPKEIVDLLANLSVTCKAETGVDQNAVDELRKANLIDDPKVKCYLKCMMQQLQTMKDDGSLDIELIEASMPDVLKEHGGIETLHKCKHIQEADLCETAYQLMVCFKRENPELTVMFE